MSLGVALSPEQPEGLDNSGKAKLTAPRRTYSNPSRLAFLESEKVSREQDILNTLPCTDPVKADMDGPAGSIQRTHSENGLNYWDGKNSEANRNGAISQSNQDQRPSASISSMASTVPDVGLANRAYEPPLPGSHMSNSTSMNSLSPNCSGFYGGVATPSPAFTPSSNGHDQPILAHTSELRDSTGGHSYTTSNSSFQYSSRRQSGQTNPTKVPHVTPNPNYSQAALAEVDHTAGLIRKLYARLEEQGVPGDGWEEGKERSRDGIINRHPRDDDYPTVGVKEEVDNTKIFEAETEKALPVKQNQVLKKVDRYGFFSNSHPAALASQHNRLASLSSMPYENLPGEIRNSLRRSSPAGTKILSHEQKLSHRASTASFLNPLTPLDMALETKRIDKWAGMLKVQARDEGGNVIDWKVADGVWSGRRSQKGNYRKFQRRVFKGIPDRWRRAVWGLMMEQSAREAKPSGQQIRTLSELMDFYESSLKTPSSQDVQIDLDVPRTISGHVLFHTRYGQGQRALFHVLHAFALHCEDIGGYCQGMGALAATLLCYFEPERAFCGLVRLFDQYRLRHIFEPGFPGLVEAFYVQERLVDLLMPNVSKAFKEHCISTSSYATKWYITLFANSVPFKTQLRLWDGFLLEGIDILTIGAVAIIWCFKDQFTAATACFESILSVLSSYFFVDSDDLFLRWIRKVLRRKDLREKMRGWRAEWKQFVLDGTSYSHMT